MVGRGHRYHFQTQGLPLSLKSIRQGRARYVVERAEMAIDDHGWLIVNEDQPYTIDIHAVRPAETFIVWFPRGWAEEVFSSVTTPTDALLTEPATTAPRLEWHSRYTENEAEVAPRVEALRAALRPDETLDDLWLEQQLRSLLAGMLAAEGRLRPAQRSLPAVRAATRAELWRRLNRARDFIHARCDTALTLSDMAGVATLSPFHFLRAFRSAFGVTPHGWLTQCRANHAKFLLERTDLPVTEICAASGYESLGSFSTWFQRVTGASPRAWRREHGHRSPIRKIREVGGRESVLSSTHLA